MQPKLFPPIYDESKNVVKPKQCSCWKMRSWFSKPRAEKDERWNITELSGSPLKQNVMIS